MKRFLVVLFVSLVAASAQAGLDHTAVSINGSDTNPCSLQQPCATFAVAIANTNPDGELIALDSGAYDGFTIDRQMSITVAPGAVVTVGKEPGVTNWAIKVDAAGKLVSIRGVVVKATGTSFGIAASDAAVTSIDDVVIEGFGCDSGCGTGIFGGGGELIVHNARIRNVYTGIHHNPLGPSDATITDSIVQNATNGISADNFGRATVRNTVVMNTERAFSSGSLDPEAKPELTLVDCTATNNGRGVLSGTNATVRMERTAVTRNAVGLENIGGTIVTHGNNMVAGNGTNVAGTVTSAGLM